MVEGASGKRVTRDVELSAVGDLLQHPPHCTVAFVEREEVEVVPARARCGDQVYWFALLDGAAPDLESREVVLVIDDGPYWFELRGISVRGVARRVVPAERETPGLVWYSIESRRLLAWDYGALRET